MTDIVLTDDAATPVDHTFTPARNEPDSMLYENRETGIYVGYGKLFLALRRPTGANARNLKAIIRLERPVLKQVSGADVGGFTPAAELDYRPVAECVFTFPDKTTLQQRKDIHKMFKDALQESPVESLIQNYVVPAA